MLETKASLASCKSSGFAKVAFAFLRIESVCVCPFSRSSQVTFCMEGLGHSLCTSEDARCARAILGRSAKVAVS